MKKTIVLLLILGSFATVHAQSSKDEARRVILGQPKKATSSQQGKTVITGKNSQGKKIYKTNRKVYYHRKTDHGKHLGWYKGTGNPHRYGMKPGKGKKKG